MKYLVVVVVIVGAFLLGYLNRPPIPPTRPPLPGKTDTIYVSAPSIPELVQERVFVPGADVPVPVRYTITEFDTVSVPCAEIAPRRRLLSAQFGTNYGDSTLVATESMSFSNGSLVFKSRIESLYTDGMPVRIWSELDGVRVEWIDFPVQEINSCSIWTKILSGSVGCGACTILDRINQ